MNMSTKPSIDAGGSEKDAIVKPPPQARSLQLIHVLRGDGARLF